MLEVDVRDSLRDEHVVTSAAASGLVDKKTEESFFVLAR